MQIQLITKGSAFPIGSTFQMATKNGMSRHFGELLIYALQKQFGHILFQWLYIQPD